MNNQPTYKIHGAARREMKKRASLLKGFLKTFWYDHQMDKDMASFYGGSPGYPMSDEAAQEMFDTKTKELEILNAKLSVLYLEKG